jgi:hypothetical protein
MEYSLRQGYGKSMAILVLGKLVSTTYNLGIKDHARVI